MNRRVFMVLFGAAALRPPAVRAQQKALPVVGVMYTGRSAQSTHVAAAIEKGLSEAGLAVGHDVTVDYGWAEERYDRLPAIAGNFVRRNVAVIVATGGLPGARAAKARRSASFFAHRSRWTGRSWHERVI